MPCVITTAPGFKESSYCSESEDNRTYSHWEAGTGAHPPVSLPGHTSLCLSDTEQTPSHPGWVLRQQNSYLFSFETLNRCLLYLSSLHCASCHLVQNVLFLYLLKRSNICLCVWIQTMWVVGRCLLICTSAITFLRMQCGFILEK